MSEQTFQQQAQTLTDDVGKLKLAIPALINAQTTVLSQLAATRQQLQDLQSQGTVDLSQQIKDLEALESTVEQATNTANSALGT